MNSANKVADIFGAAGLAFSTLGKLTMQLHSSENANAGTKWSEDEIEMLRSSIKKFGEDLDKLTEHIKEKTVTQIHSGLKKKTFESAGIVVTKPVTSSQNNIMQTLSSNPSQQTVVVVQQPPMITSKSTAEVTLNMLNASENEVDVEGFNFEGANEVVNN
nr:EOG090X0LYT [Scapholeberis mucronata]